MLEDRGNLGQQLFVVSRAALVLPWCYTTGPHPDVSSEKFKVAICFLLLRCSSSDVLPASIALFS